MTTGALITREPVVNQQRAITANRLIVHAPNFATALQTLEMHRQYWPTIHPVFISFGRLVPTPELLDWQPPENALIEIPAPAMQYPQIQELVLKLQAAGVPLALSWYQPGTPWPEQADCRFVLADQAKVTSPAGAPGISLAWGLADVQAFADAVERGYAGAAGWFFLKGVTPAKELAPSHAQIVRLLNLVRNDADITEIEAALKQDVSLPYKLLRYINSVGFGLMVEVQSFRHAVTILGRDKLNKWLSLLLVSASRDPAAPAVMQAAIARGRMMELLGAHLFDKAQHDNLFITGAFSLLDVLLGTSLDVVLDQMTLPGSIRDALLHDDGAYAPFLRLAVASESFLPDQLRAQSEALGLTVQQVSAALLQAVAFADTLSFG
ncbi:MAG: regulator [Candidatus Dactylopiibacterium carminicum]|uniref:HDOD domain-containing protein n=1 Tax=Candidatus Dactylopiibacterium carminicum TaxID=857335 RepID=A0A272EP21_9RHOO|nr:HDOD domain-containing protein [Candidatus Dactylopiibacterium carminicum]KAF7598215.1 HDOD domain-containing protein [Candidatus Dactylopiibacterium carminicum]PAS91867.1 MAG: regulator [Candidatus Dactylopiibacterium carminicum]PAS94842.1 MAG: regulator [Candidatus Dactylopiibacterium carminicum]PAS97010.1 MAG: regulator [Candidatus Dactylopiibacterium carminicum]